MRTKGLNRKGFTLGEMITTTAIIATLASLTIPNYLRYRMEVNTELVRQHMRMIAEKMVEILGREGHFPEMDRWVQWNDGQLSQSQEEVSITANLSAIDDLCYTTSDYTTDAHLGSYRFCSHPKSIGCGRYAGTKKFCIHYSTEMAHLFAVGQVGEVEMWNGEGQVMNVSGFVGAHPGQAGEALSGFLANDFFTREEKVEALTASLIHNAWELESYKPHEECFPTGPSTFNCGQVGTYVSPIPLGTVLALSDAAKSEFDDIFTEVRQNLLNENIHISMKSLSVNGPSSFDIDVGDGSDMTLFEQGVDTYMSFLRPVGVPIPVQYYEMSFEVPERNAWFPWTIYTYDDAIARICGYDPYQCEPS